MELVGIEETDIYMDDRGQPVASENGDFKVAENIDCWMQDIRNEMLTAEGELFYEDQEDIEAYGYSLVDFLNIEYDEMDIEEIKQRIREKLGKRKDIDEDSILIAVVPDAAGDYHAAVRFQQLDESRKYDMDIDLSEIEVVSDD